MLALIIMLFNDFGLTPWVGNIMFSFAIFMTLISGFDYLYKNRHIILESL
jgi:CDP-diacylglycerol--glycerol-3-phosphate 3-phosphatidyltransferase